MFICALPILFIVVSRISIVRLYGVGRQMLWVLMGILLVGGAFAMGNEALGGTASDSQKIAGVTALSALLIFLSRGYLRRGNDQILIKYALTWLAIAAAIIITWLWVGVR